MALQLHKDSIDISSNDVTSDTTQPNVNGNHSVTMIHDVDPRNNPTHLHSNDRNNLQALLHLSTSLHTSEARTNSNDESNTIGQMDAEVSFLTLRFWPNIVSFVTTIFVIYIEQGPFPFLLNFLYIK